MGAQIRLHTMANMAPPYLGAVSSTNIPYVRKLPITTMGGPTYTYSNQNIYPSPQNSFMQTQTTYPQLSDHLPQPQNFNM